MSTQTIDVALTFVHKADRVQQDRYLVGEYAVDLADEEQTCSCGADSCWHAVAAMVAQARRNREVALGL